MDLATVLSRVDGRQYATPHDYLADVARIVQASGSGATCCAARRGGRNGGGVLAFVVGGLSGRAGCCRLGPAPTLASLLCYAAPALLQCSREHWGPTPGSEGVREISRACALEDEARGALARAVPAELLARLEEMVVQGGPTPPPPSERARRRRGVPLPGRRC